MYVKKEKIYPASVSNHIVKSSDNKKQVILLIIPIREKRGAKSKGCKASKKKYQHYLEELHQKIMVIFIVWTAFIPLE